MKKKLAIFVLSLTLVLTLIIPTYAENMSANISSTINLNSNYSDLEISEVMTYDEMIIELMKNENITKKEAIKTLGTRTKFDAMTNTTVSRTFRTIAQRFTVSPSYRPQMRFYCETEEGYYFRAIYEILNVGMNRYYDGISKQFGGDVYVHLKTANEIFFIVNGDFYNNGTTSGGGDMAIGLDEVVKVRFHVSGSSNHFKYCYTEESAYF